MNEPMPWFRDLKTFFFSAHYNCLSFYIFGQEREKKNYTEKISFKQFKMAECLKSNINALSNSVSHNWCLRFCKDKENYTQRWWRHHEDIITIFSLPSNSPVPSFSVLLRLLQCIYPHWMDSLSEAHYNVTSSTNPQTKQVRFIWGSFSSWFRSCLPWHILDRRC